MGHRIAIVGGGISGLALLHELRRREADAVLYEAAAEPGGVIRSLASDGRILDSGPQRTRLVPAIARLVAELGLGGELVTARPGLPLFVWRNGRLRLVPRSASELRRTSLLSLGGKLRVLLEPLAGPPRSDETVADLFVRSFGGEAYGALLGPLFGGIYGTDPARMRVRHSLAELLDEVGARRSMLLALLRRRRAGETAPPPVTFRDGMQALPRALARAHPDRVRLEAPVRSVARADRGWEFEAGGGRVTAETVVLATPADAAAAILREAAPEAAGRLGRLAYNRLVVVHLHADCPLDGYGYQVAFGEELETRGVTWNASLFGRDGVYTAYLGGARNQEPAGRSDPELGETAAGEFEAVTGCRTRTLRVSPTRMPAFDLSWEALDRLELPPGIRLCASYLSRPGITGRLKAATELAEELTASA